MHKVFISYHHEFDQFYKNELLGLGVFIDGSVDTGDIDDHLPDARIREIIRDNYLRDTTVTVLLVGAGTRGRKHVDWELYSSMFDGTRNKRSGVLVIMLPTTGCLNFHVAHDGEKATVYPDDGPCSTVTERAEYERMYPYMPARIIDNLLVPETKISVTPWCRVYADAPKLEFLIDAAYRDRLYCKYDLSRPMKRGNS